MSVQPPKQMPYVRLGNSGLKVSRIILGMMSYGDSNWQLWEEGIKHVKAAYDAGIQTFDTANVYSNGLSEVILGKAIKQHNLPRDEIVVMTKVHHLVAREYGQILIDFKDADSLGYVNQYGLSRKHIFDSVKKSLERLQLDCIVVLQCHRFSHDTPIEETMQALHDVVQAGYVRYIGMSSCYAYQYYAIQNRLTSFISMQNHYSLIYREEEREMFPNSEGLLTRRRGGEQSKWSETDKRLKRYDQSEAFEKIVDRAEEISKKRGISMSQVAVAWVLSRPGVTAPIVGTTKLENLYEIVEGVHVKLTEEEINYLEEPYVPQAIVGHV
ncbi:Aldo keto reductase [Coniophora puteana RWD-64-598 SS2]|uniref:Aldo keto reductase n=1 Tax=Coniophora puteana (strain RWD-64-598) TaxID=741705 RepID=A0A5M3MYA2_CONPW|nr:Aldo keto reductase [Coniophora puteana RWD-64-598 SS2]EIW83754.1 Aldo keto reductase [Coniophora puteana RWD-64-598 SS2]